METGGEFLWLMRWSNFMHLNSKFQQNFFKSVVLRNKIVLFWFRSLLFLAEFYKCGC